eukprot:UN27813
MKSFVGQVKLRGGGSNLTPTLNPQNEHSLMTDHGNVVRENFFRDFGDVILIKSLFKPDQTYQSHQLPNDLDTYMRKYSSSKKLPVY